MSEMIKPEAITTPCACSATPVQPAAAPSSQPQAQPAAKPAGKGKRTRKPQVNN